MKILCIIPARSGSKGIPHKNIKKLNGLPLIAYSIKQALQTKYYKNKQMDIIVSTDSDEYKKVAEKYGANVPVLRPKDISLDNSTDYEFIKHMVDYQKSKGIKYEMILQLRPTQPIRRVSDIDKCLDIFVKEYVNYDSLRTVIENDKTPYKMYSLEDSHLKSLLKVDGIKESFNMGRQYLPKTYLHNGYIDILKPELLEDEMISGERIYGYVMNKEDKYDIDTLEDWEETEKYLKNNI
jgi:CMP-N,N'-diacetyllegionaminic acid synthase